MWQAASDHHRLVEILKELYRGPWISTGKSKGGQAAVFHRSFFPDDVDGTVAFVAPIMFSREDPRLLNGVVEALGPEAIERCDRLQALWLANRAELRCRVAATVDPGGLSLALNDFLDVAILNLPFDAFLHAGSSRFATPEAPDLDEAISLYLELVDMDAYRQRNHGTQSVLHYQIAIEIGFFNYRQGHLEKLLAHPDGLDCALLAGSAEVPTFNPRVTRAVVDRLKHADPSMILIYGAQDLWPSCRLDTTGMTNVETVIHDGVAHEVSLADLTPGERRTFNSRLREWLLRGAAVVGKRGPRAHVGNQPGVLDSRSQHDLRGSQARPSRSDLRHGQYLGET